MKLPLNIEYIIQKDDSFRLLGQIIEEMGLKEFDIGIAEEEVRPIDSQ